MKIEKAEKRDRNRKKRGKMGVSGKSLFTIQAVLIKRSSKAQNGERKFDSSSLSGRIAG